MNVENFTLFHIPIYLKWIFKIIAYDVKQLSIYRMIIYKPFSELLNVIIFHEGMLLFQFTYENIEVEEQC